MKFSVAAALLTSTAGSTTAGPRTSGGTSPLSNFVAAAAAAAGNAVVPDKFLSLSSSSFSSTKQHSSRKKPTAVTNGQKLVNLQRRHDSILQQDNQERQQRPQQKQQQQLTSSGLRKQQPQQRQADHNTQEEQPQQGGSRRLKRNKHRTRQRKSSNKSKFHQRRNLLKNKKRRDLKASANLRLTNPSSTGSDEYGNLLTSPILCDPTTRSTNRDAASSSTSSSSSSSSYQRKTVSTRNNDKSGDAAAAATGASGPDVGILSCGLGLYCRPHPTSETGGYCVQQDLTATTMDNNQEEERIDDSSSNNVDVEADVGILQAPPLLQQPFDHFTTSANDDSNHFHHRVHSRHMQGEYDIDFAELEEEYCNNENFTCSECLVDQDAYIGRIDCDYPEPCEALEDSYCGSGNISQICFDNTITITFDSSLYNITFCYAYSTPLDKIDLTYCVTYLYNENDGTTCQIKVDDVECTSCEYIYRPDNDDGNLVVFDCENTVLGFSGNETEEESILEGFLDYDVAYYFLPCSGGCNACGRGRGMNELDAIIQFPNGDYESCDAFQLAYLTGQRGPGSDGCDDFVPDQTVADTCQCYGFGVPVITSPTAPPSMSPNEGSGDLTVIDYLNGVCTTFNSIFDCESCDVDPEAFTANVSCTSIQSCRDISSQCDSPVNMCSSQEIVANVTSMDDYETTVCYETTTKDFDYQFTYCITYEKTSPPSCRMSVDGIECTSCNISSSNGGNNDDDDCYVFDCTNTMVGYAGSTCTADLTSTLETYFLYKLLPCDDGCSLCADDETMTDGGQTFTYNDEEYNCLEEQLSALVGPTDDAFCTGAASAASEVCGCKDTTILPPTSPPSAASSRSIQFPTMKGLVSVITLGVSVAAAASAVFAAATT